MINFDPKSVAQVTPNTVDVMVEAYCLDSASTIKDFVLSDPCRVDEVSGTLSYYGLNWNWWKRFWNANTAICGWIGNGTDQLVTFDIQGRGAEPVTIPIYASFASGIALPLVRFNMLADLALPTDFRVALVFHRCG